MANFDDEEEEGPGPGGGAKAAAPADTAAFDPDKALAAVRGGGAPSDSGAFDPDAALSAVRSAQPASLGTVAGKSFAHGAASYPASVVGTPAALGALSAPTDNPYTTAIRSDMPVLGAAGPALRAVGKFVQPLTDRLQGLADKYAPSPTDAEVGTNKLRQALSKGSEIAGNVATGAALGGVTGAIKGRVLGMGAEQAATDQLGVAKAAERSSYGAAGPQVLSHPDIDSFMSSSVPEIRDAASAATDALNIRAARAGAGPQELSNLQQAAAQDVDPRRAAQALGLSPEAQSAALAAIDGGPTTVERFDLVRRGVNDAIDATYRRAANGTAAPADISRARQLRQWIDAVTPIADKQVPEYAAARLAHGTVAGLNNATDYLSSRSGNAGDLANLAGSAAWWAMDPTGGYPAFRTVNAAARLVSRGNEAAKDLTPQGQRLVAAAKALAARRNAQAGAIRGAIPGVATGGDASR